MHIFIPYFYSSYHVFLFKKSAKKKSSKCSNFFSHPHYTSLSTYNPPFLSPIIPIFFGAKEMQK
jgi:hypothetical protein